MSVDKILQTLSESGSADMTTAEVAEAAGTHSSDASDALRRAMEHGFVQRRRARNARSQPTFRWRLTTDGRGYLDELDAEDWTV